MLFFEVFSDDPLILPLTLDLKVYVCFYFANIVLFVEGRRWREISECSHPQQPAPCLSSSQYGVVAHYLRVLASNILVILNKIHYLQYHADGSVACPGMSHHIPVFTFPCLKDTSQPCFPCLLLPPLTLQYFTLA